jgi:TolB-like protein/DNA-binding winged helix-turn-helix (wHTH) protein/Tfp pilus assembly protein PilF
VFEADMRLGSLSKQGRRVPIQEQPFQVLAMLLERPGDLITRNEIRERIWPQTVVDFDHGLNKAISKIRDALGDSADNPRFIETVASRGYRFLADASAVADVAVEKAGGSESVSRSARPRRWRWGIALAIVMAGVLAWIFLPSRHGAPPLRSLAVLPFQNLSGDPSQEYFADGMTDELITNLGQISALRVISNGSALSYKGAHKALPLIAQELNVEALVEGSVLRFGDRVRINAQLIRLPADEHIWAHSYEGNIRDTLALQSEVAQAIAQQIGTTLTKREQTALQTSRSVNPTAYEAFLKGRYFWSKRNREDLSKAIDYFNHAIEIDPLYAEAYSGLADTYALAGDWEYGIFSPAVAFSKAQTSAAKALSLDDSLSEAHTSLAFALDLYGWNWDAAEREYTRALQLNPGYATAHQWYAWHLLVTGRKSEGILQLRRAESLDPLSLIISADLADALCIAHLYDDSIRQSLKTLEIDPTFAVAHYELGQAYEQKQLHAKAIAEFQKAIDLGGHNAAFDSNLGYVYAVSGRTQQALSMAEDLRERIGANPSALANIALIYIGLGDRDQAMLWLNKAYDARFNPSILLRPAFDSMRSDARFTDLQRRIGIMQNTQAASTNSGPSLMVGQAM